MMTLVGRFFSDQPSAVIGILWMLLSGVLFVVVTAIVRYLGSDLPAVQAAFLRYLIGVFLVLPMIYRYWNLRSHQSSLPQYAIRGTAHAVGVMLWFFAMSRAPVAQVVALGFLTPVCITLGAAIFLGEKLHARRIGGIVCALIGALIIVQPGIVQISLAVWAQLLAAPCFAASYLFAKKFTSTASSNEIVMMLTLFCTLALLPGAMMQWQTPTFSELTWLTATAIAATLGHYTMTRALRAAPISLLQPFTFLQLVWATLVGITLFGETPGINIFAGAALIVAATSYISHREYQLKQQGKTQA